VDLGAEELAELLGGRDAELGQLEHKLDLLVELEEAGLLDLQLDLEVGAEVLDGDVDVGDLVVLAQLDRGLELAGEALAERLGVELGEAIIERAEGVADLLDVEVADA